jgi:ribosome-binding protein aMBF1 (putative translation factor)
MQTIKSVDGQEFVLLPVSCYQGLKNQIDEFIAKEQSEDDEYVPFVVEDFIKNPVALARIKAGVTQKELATLMGDTQGYISQLENSANVSAEAMLKVTNALKNYPDKWPAE